MPDTVFGTDALHRALVVAKVHLPLSHVVLRWVVDATRTPFAFIWRVGNQLLQIRFFEF